MTADTGGSPGFVPGAESSAKGRAVLLLCIFFLAAGIRSLPWTQVFSGGSVFFYDGDNYMHLRKILLHIAAFPHFVSFDFYEGYPHGSAAIWPPVLDYLLSILSLAIGFGTPSVRTVEVVAALSSPVAGGLTAVALYYYARQIFGGGVAVAAAVIFSFLPAHISSTVVGRPDNEMLEPLMAVLLFFSYNVMQEKGKESPEEKLPVFLMAAAAFSALILWRGATVWVLLAAAGIFIEISADLIRGDSFLGGYRRGSAMFGLLAACLSALCLFNVWGRQNTISFNILSWFHVILFSSVSVAVLFFGFVSEQGMKRGYGRQYLLIPVLLAAVLLSAGLILSPPVLKDNILSGLGMLGIGQADPWIQSIAEYRPLLQARGFDILIPVRLYGWLFWILPFACCLLAADLYRKGFERGRSFFLLATAVIFVLAVLRSRFMHILALNAAITGAYVMHTAYGSFSRRAQLRSITYPRSAALAAAAAVAVLIFYPLARYWYYLPLHHPGFSIRGDIGDAMAWMKLNTPSPGDPYARGARPSYGVMGRWDFGGWIEYLAERPAVGTLYGSETYGLKESAEFFLCEDEDSAGEIMERTGARYFVAYQAIGALGTYARIVGRPEGDYAELRRLPVSGEMSYLPGRRYYDLVSTRLLMADGISMKAGRIHLRQVGHYRLVYESEGRLNIRGFPNEVRKLKVFERLPGVSLTVNSKPGRSVTVSSSIRTNTGREFEFRREGQTDNDGTVIFDLPYPALGRPGTTGTVRPYTVQAGGAAVELTATEAEVLEGREVVMNLP